MSLDKSMILAIETSCDETSIAILKDGKDVTEEYKNIKWFNF